MDDQTATLIASSMAAVTSLVVAFFTIRTQNKIENQKFFIEKDLQSFVDRLSRDRELSEFNRTLVMSHLDGVFLSYQKIHGITKKVILRSWLTTMSDLEAETAFREAIIQLMVNYNSLVTRNLIPSNLQNEGHVVYGIEYTWSRLMGEAVLRTDYYKKAVPDDRDFSEKIYKKIWDELHQEVEELGGFVTKLYNEIRLPS